MQDLLVIVPSNMCSVKIAMSVHGEREVSKLLRARKFQDTHTHLCRGGNI